MPDDLDFNAPVLHDWAGDDVATFDEPADVRAQQPDPDDEADLDGFDDDHDQDFDDAAAMSLIDKLDIDWDSPSNVRLFRDDELILGDDADDDLAA